MRYLTTILCLLALTALSHAQKCKYRVDRVDKFTGKTYLAVGHQLFSNNTEYAELAIINSTDTIYAIFTYDESQVMPTFEVDTMHSLILVANDSSSIKLACQQKTLNKYRASGGGVSSNLQVRFPLTRDMLSYIVEKSLKLFVLEHKQGHLLRTVKPKDAEGLQSVAKCFVERL